jgi:hypothetical protein
MVQDKLKMQAAAGLVVAEAKTETRQAQERQGKALTGELEEQEGAPVAVAVRLKRL